MAGIFKNKPAKTPKQPKPADIPDISALDLSEPKLLTEVHYKEHTFPVRKNFIGVGQRITKLINDYDNSVFIEPLWLMRQPEYEEYALVIHNCRQYMADIAAHKKKLKATAPSDKAVIKEYEDIIAAGTRALNAETASLRNKPAVAAAGARYNAIIEQVRFSFVNDPANIKEAAEILLSGDISVIDFDTYDESLAAFRDEVFSVFFSMKTRMQS